VTTPRLALWRSQAISPVSLVTGSLPASFPTALAWAIQRRWLPVLHRKLRRAASEDLVVPSDTYGSEDLLFLRLRETDCHHLRGRPDVAPRSRTAANQPRAF